VGKSHFVQTVIAAHQARWRYGALYVSLTPAPTGATQTQFTPERQQMAVTTLARALAAPFAITLQPNQDYGEQLQVALSGYACCLVLDNFEQILPAAAYLQSLLARAGQVTVIAISRLRLGLAAEVNLTLTGLPLAPVLNQGGPESRSSPADTKGNEPASGTALALLTHNLTRHLPGFQPTAADRVALQQICRAVHGLPLALELAPVLARRLPLTEVAARLTAEPLTLSADFADLPEQQRSLYTVLDAMFTAASPAVQEALVRLSVFAGTFTAADAVCLVKSPLLAEIKQQSWLEIVAPEQLTLHPLVASFVRGLCVDQKWAMIYAQARRAHAGYYAKLVDGQRFFQNPHYTAGTIWLRQHFAEITTACQTFLAETPEAAVPLLHVIAMYGHHFGDQQTVHQWLRQGLDKLPTTLPARFRLLLDYVACTTELRNVAAANAALVEARIYAADQDDQAALLALYERLAWAAHTDYAADSPQRRQEGRHYFSQGLALAETMGDQSQVVNMLAHRAFFTCWQEDGYAQAQADLQQALTIAHQLGQPGVLGIVYKILAYVEFVAGHLVLAQRYSERAMQLLAAEGGMLMTLGWLYMERSQIALAQRDTPAALHYLTLAGEIFRPVAYEAGLTQCHTLLGIVALLEGDAADAERCWLRAYRAIQQMNGQDKLTVTLMLGIGVTQLINGDPMLGAQLVTVAREQYQERSFHWVQPEQQLMTALLERAIAEMTILALPAMAIDAQVAAQAILLLPEQALL
jgi:tetratricopeptide (TPR) repeat protein